jgi:uncharacterized protein
VRLSREKILRLSHLILHYIESDEGVDYFDEPQHVRQQVVRIIEGEMRADEAIDGLVRRKLESLKRGVPEGSAEWDVLYRKYYEEETSRHRKLMP